MSIYTITGAFLIFFAGVFFGKVYFQVPSEQILSTQDIQKRETFDKVREKIKPKIDEVVVSSKLPYFIEAELKAYGYESKGLSEDDWNDFIDEFKKEAFKEKTEQFMFNGNSLLHYIASSKDLNIQQMKALIDLGFDINKKNRDGKTPLNIAIQSQRFSRNIEELMKLGAVLDEESMIAALRNSNDYSKEEMIKLLQEKGYDFKDDKYFNELLYNGNDEYFKEYLKTADVNMQDTKDISSFEQVIKARKGNDIIEYYLDNGVDLSTQSDGFNAVHASMVSQNISLENIQRIIDAGADVNARVPKIEMTPLMYAVKQNGVSNEQKLARIELLLKNGADIRLYDTMARDAYQFASKLKDEQLKDDVVALLKKYEE